MVLPRIPYARALRQGAPRCPNILIAPGVDDNEQPAQGTHTKRDEALFAGIRFVIDDCDGVGIIEDWNGFWHADAVFAEVDSSLALFVPLETHIPIVSTICTYVNTRRFEM